MSRGSLLVLRMPGTMSPSTVYIYIGKGDANADEKSSIFVFSSKSAFIRVHHCKKIDF